MAEPLPLAAAAVEYPESDGKPVETKQHYLVAHYVMAVFRDFYGDSADYASNHGLYYQEGNPKKVVVPDVYWIGNKPFRMPPTYLLWREGRVPDFVLELASKTTKKRDAGKKRRLYARLGVKDYFRFDPVGGLMRPVLQGLRLGSKGYKEVDALPLVDGGMSVRSEALGLDLRAWPVPKTTVREGDAFPTLRLYDPRSGQVLDGESKALAGERRQRAAAERARQAAESGRQAAESERQAAESERQAEEQQRQAAEQERDRLASEVAALRDQLAKRDAR